MKSLILGLALGALTLPVALQAVYGADTESPTAGKTAPDNSGRNVRDRDAAAVTPMDQGTSDADIAITQTIRKAVTSHSDLSVDAQNVKIITQDGVVTLRGPVKNAAEKATIASLSMKTEGVKRVDNQLEAAGLR